MSPLFVQLSSRLFTVIVILTASTDAIAATNIIATIEPHKRVLLRAEVSGIVESAPANIGDDVQIGQLLGNLNSDDYLLNMKLTQAVIQLRKSELVLSENQLKRLDQLHSNKSISASLYEKQKADFEINKSQLLIDKLKSSIAKSTLEKTQIKTPFNGVVSTRHIEKGQLLNIGDPIFEIVDISKVKIVFYLLETDLTKIKNIENVVVEIPAADSDHRHATIIRIAPARVAIPKRIKLTTSEKELTTKITEGQL